MCCVDVALSDRTFGVKLRFVLSLEAPPSRCSIAVQLHVRTQQLRMAMQSLGAAAVRLSAATRGYASQP